MGININEIDQTNIILNVIYITYSVLSRLNLPNVRSVTLASIVIRMPKLRRFLMRGQRLSLCQQHISKTSHHSKTGWVLYQRKISHKITDRFITINQPCSQQSSWPSNQPAFQLLHPVCKKITRKCCSVFLCCKK